MNTSSLVHVQSPAMEGGTYPWLNGGLSFHRAAWYILQHATWRKAPWKGQGCPGGSWRRMQPPKGGVFLFFFEFLTLKVSLSVLGEPRKAECPFMYSTGAPRN